MPLPDCPDTRQIVLTSSVQAYNGTHPILFIRREWSILSRRTHLSAMCTTQLLARQEHVLIRHQEFTDDVAIR